jgi:hypothetical protein
LAKKGGGAKEKGKKGKKEKKEKIEAHLPEPCPADLSQLKRFFLEEFWNSGILTVLLTATIWNSRY